MSSPKHDYRQEAQDAISALGIDLSQHEFTLDDLARGIEVEYEHGTINPLTNVTDDDPLMTAKIALAHLLEKKEKYPMPNPQNEQYDYYDGLECVEETPPGFWRNVTPRGLISLRWLAAVLAIAILFLVWYATRGEDGAWLAGGLAVALLFTGWPLFAMQYYLKPESSGAGAN